MIQPTYPIPVDHRTVSHEIDPSLDGAPRPLTLLELVEAVSEVTQDEQEILATVGWMLESGRVKLIHSEIRRPQESSRSHESTVRWQASDAAAPNQHA